MGVALPVLLLLSTPLWDAPMQSAWPAKRAWTPAEEARFGRFVERLGDAVRAGRCARLDACLRDPAANTLYDRHLDEQPNFFVDCADLPYTLRAFYAFRRSLPFGFVARVQGVGDGDERFMREARPVEWRDWREFATPASLLAALPGIVHTGMLRVAAPVEETDFYPVRIQRGAIGPGAVFYDPGGHVQVVASVGADGSVRFIDGHPDGTLTASRLPAYATAGPFELGGGFKRFRPMRLERPRRKKPGVVESAAGPPLIRVPNVSLADFDPRFQWTLGKAGGAGARTFVESVRRALARPGHKADRVADFGAVLDDVCRALVDRVSVVDGAVAAGLPARRHPERLPENVFGGSGEWETWSTPGKDVRIRAAFLELRDLALASPARLRARMKPVLDARLIDRRCRVHYKGSRGALVELGLGDVIDRAFAISFDPFDCPERRWGAPAGSTEAAACVASPEAERFYQAEARLRYRTDRGFGEATPLDDGPHEPPAIDPRPVLARGAQGVGVKMDRK